MWLALDFLCIRCADDDYLVEIGTAVPGQFLHAVTTGPNKIINLGSGIVLRVIYC